MIEPTGGKKRASPHPAAHIAGPLARTTRQEVRRARGPSELHSESSDMRGGFGSLASARPPYAGRRLRRKEACALWALGPKAQSDPKRGSETMRATVRECA